LLAVAVAAAVSLAIHLRHVWARLHSAETAVRVTSTRTVVWGGHELPIAAMKAEFDRQIRALRLQGFKPSLLIESYSNTPHDAVEELAAVGANAGFEEVSQRQLDWPDSRGTSDRR